eukprot:3537224-Alexandrium_andersonii.AAC.1
MIWAPARGGVAAHSARTGSRESPLRTDGRPLHRARNSAEQPQRSPDRYSFGPVAPFCQLFVAQLTRPSHCCVFARACAGACARACA